MIPVRSASCRLRCQIAIFRASRVRLVDVCHPTMRREYTIGDESDVHPLVEGPGIRDVCRPLLVEVERLEVSVHQVRRALVPHCGAGGARWRSAPDVVHSQGVHEVLEGAAGHATRPVVLGDLGLVEHHLHLAGPERGVVVSVNLLDLGFESFITHAPGAGRPGPASCS